MKVNNLNNNMVLELDVDEYNAIDEIRRTILDVIFNSANCSEFLNETTIKEIIGNEVKLEKVVNLPYIHQEIPVDRANNKLPNNVDSIYSKYSKNIVNEHINQDNGEIVDTDDIKNLKANSLRFRKFRCPNCKQATLAKVISNADTILAPGLEYIICLYEEQKSYLCVLNSEMSNIINDFTKHENDNTINFVLNTLKEDNKYLLEEYVDIYIGLTKELAKESDMFCPCCHSENSIDKWVDEYITNMGENLCEICGKEKLIEFGSVEDFKCENPDCYSNREVQDGE